MRGALYQVFFGGGLGLVNANAQALTSANGTASMYLVLPGVPSLPSTLLFVVHDVVAPAGAPAYALGLNQVSNKTIGY